MRCGVCATSFNALENLSEQPFRPSSDDDAPSADDSMTVEDLPGSENIELSAPVEFAAVPGAVPTAPQETPADEEARAMEFHGDSADLDRLFIVEDPALTRFDPAEEAATLAANDPEPELDSTDEHPILVLDERDKLSDDDVGESIVLETTGSVPEPLRDLPPPKSLTAPRILIPDEMRKRLEEEAAARKRISIDEIGSGTLMVMRIVLEMVCPRTICIHCI